MIKKSITSLLIIFIFLIPLSFSAQVVQVQQPSPTPKGFFSKSFGFLKEPIFWYIVIGIVIFVVILIGVFFLIRWLVKFLKSRSDIYWMLRNERIKLCKIQRRYPSTHWWKTYKNTPIRLVKKEGNRLIVTSPVAYHRGDYTTHEGNVAICMNLINNKKFFFFPITDLLVIPNREKVTLEGKGEKGVRKAITIENLPRATDIVQFNENEILIHAESFSNVGIFYVPVLKAKDGKIIDLSLPVYQSLREVVVGEYLFSQTDEFVKVAKKSMDFSPTMRYQMKTQDQSQSVEIPSEK